MNELARFSQLLPGNQFHVELEELAKLKARVLSTDGSTAKVQLILEGEEQGQEVDFVQFEGKWIPKTLEQGWPEFVKSMREKIARELAQEVLQKKKQAVFRQFDLIEKDLAKLESANGVEEFQKQFVPSPVAGVVVAMFRRANATGGQPPSVIPKDKKQTPAGKAQTITVIVQGILSPAAADQVADKLFDLAKDADVGDFTVSGNTTRFPVTTKKPFAAFRKTLTFADVISADEKKREIVVRLK